MSKKPAAPAPAASKQNTITRHRRSTLTRLCLSKSMKRLFKDSSTPMFKAVLEAERDSKKKKP